MNDVLITNLCYIKKENKLLLALKKRGFGKDKWNGYGGKVKAGESISEAAIREVYEEAGITATKLEQRGLIHFSWASGKNGAIECHVYEIIEYSGEPIETEEMKPEWFDIDSLPYEAMWSSDRVWLPLFLKGLNFRAEFIFNDDDTVKSHVLKESSFPLDF